MDLAGSVVRPWVLLLLLMLMTLPGCVAPGGGSGTADDQAGAPVPCGHPLLSERIRMRELDVAVDPTDRDRVAIAFIGAPPAVQDDGPEDWPYWVGFALSEDGGETWDWAWAGTPPDDIDHLGIDPAGDPASVLSDPIVLFTQDGTLLFSMLAITQAEARHVVARYEPGDLEVDSATIVARGAAHPVLYGVPTPFIFLYNEKQHLRRDPLTGDVLMAWEWRAMEYPVYVDESYTRAAAMFAMSKDDGRTWTAPVQVSPEGGFVSTGSHHAADPQPLRDRKGIYHVIWLDYFTGDILHARSQDGAEWEMPSTIATVEKRFFERVRGILAVYSFEAEMDLSGGPHDGRIYLVTTDFSSDEGRLALFSSDDAMQWSGPHEIASGAYDQFQPALAVAPDGTVGILYGDRGNSTDGWSYEPFLAQSRDGASTFTVSPVTDARSDPRHIDNRLADPPRPEHPIMPGRSRVGDYWGLDVTADGWVMAWQDGREGRSEMPYSTGYTCHTPRR